MNKDQSLYNAEENVFAAGAARSLLAMDHAAVNTVKSFMERNARFVTANQLRNVYARIRASKNNDELPMLRVKLAYIKGKSDRRSKGFHQLLDLLDEMIVAVGEDDKARKQLERFFEAVLAYHKYYDIKKR